MGNIISVERTHYTREVNFGDFAYTTYMHNVINGVNMERKCRKRNVARLEKIWLKQENSVRFSGDQVETATNQSCERRRSDGPVSFDNQLVQDGKVPSTRYSHFNT